MGFHRLLDNIWILLFLFKFHDEFIVLLKKENLYLLETHTEVFTGEICMELAFKNTTARKKSEWGVDKT